MSEKRVLHIINGMQSGGAETYIMNHYKIMDKTKMQFDFLLRDGNTKGFYIETIQKLGGKVYFAPSFPRHVWKNWCHTKEFIQNTLGTYEIYEIHANALLYMVPLWILKRWKRKMNYKVIVHSHSTKCYSNKMRFIHFFHRLFIHNLSDLCLACSEEAGKWMFRDNYMVIPNAIHVKKFQQPNHPIQYKAGTVFIQVARFLEVKNHEFTIKLFTAYLKEHEDSLLVLIGEGELEEQIHKMVFEFKIEKNVLFVGAVRNVEDYLFQADAFLLPSFYEGIPLSVIEAQAAGIECFVSDRVDRVCDVSGHVHFLSIESTDLWLEELEKNQTKRYNASTELKRRKLDIQENGKLLEKIYGNE